MPQQEKLGMYIHIPFCRTRCNYCDFNTYAGKEYLIDEYIECLVKEIKLLGEVCDSGSSLQSMYFGGGTPNLLKASQFDRVINEIKRKYRFYKTIEISSEANPGMLSKDYLKDLHNLGLQRLSLGMQSAHVEELKLLGRYHTFQDVVESVRTARLAGFENINIDLIYGVPRQTLEMFQESVQKTLSLETEHLSIYCLTIEKGTPLEQMVKTGQIPNSDTDLGADMYEWVMERLEDAGFIQYEISNWAMQEKYFCAHNLLYWRNQAYLGFGAGAHSHFRGKRWANVPRIETYIQKMQQASQAAEFAPPAAEEIISLSPIDQIQETMMMGLRLVEEGVSNRDFKARFGKHIRDLYSKEIDDLTGSDLLEEDRAGNDIRYRLSQRGKMLGNQVFMRFVGE